MPAFQPRETKNDSSDRFDSALRSPAGGLRRGEKGRARGEENGAFRKNERRQAGGAARQDSGDADSRVLRPVRPESRRHARLRGAGALRDGAAHEAHEGALGVAQAALKFGTTARRNRSAQQLVLAAALERALVRRPR